MYNKNVDIENLFEGDSRPFKPLPPKPVHTLVLLSNGNLVPRNMFGQSLDIKPPSPGDRWDFSLESYGGKAVIEMLQKSSVTFDSTPRESGILALGFPDDYISFRFPRNIPWKQMPLLAKPHYRIGEEMASSISPYTLDDQLRLSVDRRPRPLEGSLKQLQRIYIQPSHGLKYLTVHRARVLLDMFEVPEIEMHVFWSDRTDIFDPIRVRNYFHRVERMNREDYNFYLNGHILLERACNRVWKDNQIPVVRKNKIPTPQKAAASLSRTITVLQTLYAIQAEQKKRGLTVEMVIDSLASIEQKIENARSEIKWSSELLEKSLEDRTAALDDWYYYTESYHHNDDMENGKIKRNEKYTRGELIEDLQYESRENSFEINQMISEKKGLNSEFNSRVIDYNFELSLSRVDNNKLNDRIVCLQRFLDYLLGLKADCLAEQTRITGNITENNDKTIVHDYGIVKYYASKHDMSYSLWTGSGAYQELNRYQYFDKSDSGGDIKHLEQAGLITKVKFLMKTSWNSKLQDFREDCKFKQIIAIPYVCTKEGDALLELLPKECKDPDIALRNEGLTDDQAIPKIDRRLMKMFRELKRKVADMPANMQE